VNIAPITMVYGRYTYIYICTYYGYKPTNITGGHHFEKRDVPALLEMLQVG